MTVLPAEFVGALAPLYQHLRARDDDQIGARNSFSVVPWTLATQVIQGLLGLGTGEHLRGEFFLLQEAEAHERILVAANGGRNRSGVPRGS